MAGNLDTVVESGTASAEQGLVQFVAGYRPLPGIFDEMMDGDGRVRAHWRPFLSMLAALGAEEINRRFGAADRYLRGSGVFYRVYEDAAGIERPWPLSHVPLIIEPAGPGKRFAKPRLSRATSARCRPRTFCFQAA
jgi:hypothetical protein